MRLGILLLALVASFISSAVAQTNDNFAGRLTLSGTHATAVSNNLQATREANEPNHAANATGRSLWWTWTAPATGVVNFSAFPGSIGVTPPRALAVYSGETVASLTEIGSSNNFDAYFYRSQFSNLAAAGASVNLAVTAGQTYQIAVDASANFSTSKDDGTVVLSINAPPTIVSAASVNTTTDASFVYNTAASAGATLYAATDLPSGLSINSVNGQITGTTSVKGTYVVGLSATGPGGMGTATLTIRVGDPVPASPSLPYLNGDVSVNGYVGAAFSYSIGATNSPLSITATDLPPGLSYSAGSIIGTPTTTGTFLVPVTETNADGTCSAVVTIHIDAAMPPPVFSSAIATTGLMGYYFSYSITTSGDSTAAAPTSYTADGLPPGMTLSATGNISGTPTQLGVYPVSISATNAGGTRSGAVTFTITSATPTSAAAPLQISSAATASAAVGVAFSYRLVASNSPTSFSASSLPSGLSLNAATGAISGTPTATGTFLVPVSATNSYGVGSATLTIAVAADANAQNALLGYGSPLITSAAAVSGYTGQTLTYQVNASYNNSSYYNSVNWTFSATGLPPGMSLASATSTTGNVAISGAPTVTGVYPAVITATYPATTRPATSTRAVVTFFINAGPIATPPVIAGTATAAGAVGTAFSYLPSATNAPTGYAASGLPPGLGISATTGTVSGTPTTAGNYPVTISATNASGTTSATVTMLIAPRGAPLITSNATSAGTVGATYAYTIAATSTPISAFAASNLPPGLSVNAATGAITGTPTAAGVYLVPVSATNAVGTGNATLTLTIADLSTTTPVISSYATASGTVGTSIYSYTISASNSPTSFAASNLPPGLSVNTSTGAISGTPTAAGTYATVISASNAGGTGSGTLTFSIAPGALPVFTSGGVQNVTVNIPWGIYMYASNSPTSFSASNLPPGFTLDASTGVISGTATTLGKYAVPVSATNAYGTTNAMMNISVTPRGTFPVPVISSAAGVAGAVGSQFSYTIRASNSPSSYNCGYNLPTGLTLNGNTGAITGIPTQPGNYPVTIQASNSSGTGSATLSIVVAAGSGGPSVVNSAAAVVALQKEAFSYQLTANGPVTGFSASNLPVGLSLSAATGLIAGTPTVPGSYAMPVTVTSPLGQSQATVTIVVLNPAFGVFTHPAAVAATVGQPFSFTPTTSGNNNSNNTANTLPAGLSINTATGVISGTPTAVGNTSVYLSRSTEYGTVRGYLLISVNAAAPVVPVISNSAGVGGYVGQPFAFSVQATNSPTSFRYSGLLPYGLTFDNYTGLVSGTPTNSGTYTTVFTAYNASGASAATYVIFTIDGAYNAPAQITSSSSVAGVVGVPLTYQITGSVNYSSYSATADNLPPGLSLDRYGFTISGTPTAAGQSVGTVTIRNNSTGLSTVATLAFNIAAQVADVPTLTSAAASTGIIGYPYSYFVSANNLPTSRGVSNLPAGLSYNATTGGISGTPTVSGTFSIPLTATNVVGTGSATLTLTILALPPAAPTISNLSLENAISVGSSQPIYLSVDGDPLSYSASGLPPGISIDAATGAFSGAPTVAGNYKVTITASNPIGSDSAVTTVVVTADLPSFNYLPANVTSYVGVAINLISVSAIGSPTSYSASGLPPGLSLNSASGYITGTPTAAGRYAVTVSANSSVGVGSAVMTIIVNEASKLKTTLYSANAAMAGTVGVTLDYSFGASTATGSGSGVYLTYTWTVTGSLPPGVISYSTSSYPYLDGTPTAAGSYPVTVTATTPSGVSVSEVLTFVIDAPPPYFTNSASVAGNVGSKLSYYLSTNNGVVPSYSVSGLPPGLTVNASGGGLISGTPTAAGVYAVTATATGSTGSTQATVTFLISPPAFGGLPLINSASTVNYSSAGSNSSSFYFVNPLYTINAINGPNSYGASNLPAGLSLNSVTGVISGQPLRAGNFQVPISATNAVGTCNATLTIIVPAALPLITSALTATGAVGTTFSLLILNSVTSSTFTLPSSSAPSDFVIYAAVGLPPGLNLNAIAGAVTGTPTQAGTYPVTISTTNRAGTSTAIITMTIAATAPAPVRSPVFTGKLMAWGFVGFPLSQAISAPGATSYAASNLPAGLSLNAATGQLTGTPGAVGTYFVPVSAANAAGVTQVILTVAVDAAPPVPAIGNAAQTYAYVGSSFGLFVSAATYTGMPAITAYRVGNLPAGLSFNAQQAYISGTLLGPPGTYQVPVTLALGAVEGSGVITIIVRPATAPSAPTLSTPAGALGYLANPLSLPLTSSRFSPAAALPAGLGFDSASTAIAGYPTETGARQISLSAPYSGNTYTALVTLNVLAPDLSLPRLSSQPAGVSIMANGSASFAIAAMGVPLPTYQWAHDGTPILGATNSTLTLSSVQAADAGTYTVIVANSSGQIISNSALLVIQQNYANWQTSHFTNAEIAAGLADDNADLNGDGINNLLAYALGIDPRMNANSSLPTAVRSSLEDALQFTFKRDAANADLKYTVEASTDLSQWTPIASSLAGAPTTNLGGAMSVVEQRVSGTSQVTVVVREGPLSGMPPRQFLRLRVTRP